MNQLEADELNVELEALLSGNELKSHEKWQALAAIAAEVRQLSDPDFKNRLKAELMEELPASGSSQAGFGQVTGAVAFAEILPTLGGNYSRLFPADHRSFAVSFLSHTALIVLIASGIWVGTTGITKTKTSLSQVTYLPLLGGGGSGQRVPIPATKGTPPKMSSLQLAPPIIVVHKPDPVLPVQSTLVGPPDVKLPQSERIGDLISSNVAMPSNGSGDGGGAGSGTGTGLGAGEGAGYGSGSDMGVGGGAFALGSRGVSAPTAIYQPEPEYSEEARKVKHQGIVVLSWVVDQQGRPRNIHVARSLGMGLDEKAIEAVKMWKFSPGTRDGIPVAVRVNLEVSFRLY